MLILSTTLTPWLGEPLGDAEITHPLNIEDLWTDEELADWDLYRVAPFELPEGKRIIFDTPPTYSMVDGVACVTFETEDVPVAVVTPPLPLVEKTTIINRIEAVGKTAALLTYLQANPVLYFKWFAPGRPFVLQDDVDTIGVLTAIGADPEVILAI
jgi:hypothetical protein